MEGPARRRPRQQCGSGVHTAHQLRLLLYHRFALLRLLWQRNRSMAVRKHGIRPRRDDVYSSHFQQAVLQDNGQCMAWRHSVLHDIHHYDNFCFSFLHSYVLTAQF